MEKQNELQKPAPALNPQSSVTSQRQLNEAQVSSQQDHNGEYDPCQNAQKFSPFYMYNHDSPRPSADVRPKQSLHVSVRDLELGDITPSVTQEKFAAQRKSKFDQFKFWERRQECLTKPKKQGWLQRLPKKQRIIVKLIIALLIAGVMVAIAVGIAAAVHSGVYGSNTVVGQHN